jgi:zinc transporter ZupT
MAVLAASILLLATLAGVLFAPAIARSRGLYSLGVAFAAGTLLTMVLTHVLPEAMAATAHAPIVFVLGFVAMLLLHQHVLRADPCCGHEHAQHAALPSFIALSVCSFNDGVMLSSEADAGLASPMVWAMAVHECNAGFALFVLLRETGGGAVRGVRRLYLLLFTLTAPVTMLALHVHQDQPWVPYVLAFSAGALLYVVAGSLVPRVEHVAREGRAPVISAFLAAVLLNVGLALWQPHDHGLDHHDHDHPPASRTGR